jgi:hypothetical protein
MGPILAKTTLTTSLPETIVVERLTCSEVIEFRRGPGAQTISRFTVVYVYLQRLANYECALITK